MARQLTRRQAEILTFIVQVIREQGCPPTIAEIGAAFGIASTNGVNDHLLALERKGYIERSSKARGIRVTDKAAVDLYRNDVGTLPLVGRIAAGEPILAESNIEGHVAVSSDLARRASYCLEVRGDSMVEDGIFDGDTIVVSQDIAPQAGDIVVALLEDEATVKRFYRRGDMVELRPANASMEPFLVPADQVQLQGVVLALQRSLR
jgi:repressor LexA